jgi:hypothetical protein
MSVQSDEKQSVESNVTREETHDDNASRHSKDEKEDGEQSSEEEEEKQDAQRPAKTPRLNWGARVGIPPPNPDASLVSYDQAIDLFTKAVEWWVCNRLAYDAFDAVFNEAVMFAREFFRSLDINLNTNVILMNFPFKDELRRLTRNKHRDAEELFRDRDLLSPYQYVSQVLPRYDWTSSNPWFTRSMSSAEASREAELSTQLQQYKSRETGVDRTVPRPSVNSNVIVPQ